MSLGNDNYLQREIVKDYAGWPRWLKALWWFGILAPHAILPGFIIWKLFTG